MNTANVTENEVRFIMDAIGDIQLNKQFDTMPIKAIENWLLQLRVAGL